MRERQTLADARAEKQVRRWLRVYPSSWREHHGDALVDTFLASGTGERRLDRRDKIDILRSSIRVRTHAMATKVARARSHDLLRHLALYFLTVQCAVATVVAWRAVHIGKLFTADLTPLWQSVVVASMASWLAALLAVASGRPRTARAIATTTLLLSAGVGLLRALEADPLPPNATASVFVGALAVIPVATIWCSSSWPTLTGSSMGWLVFGGLLAATGVWTFGFRPHIRIGGELDILVNAWSVGTIGVAVGSLLRRPVALRSETT